MPTAHTIPVTRTAHFYTLGEPSERTKRFWFVCHGYGQAAQKFIHKFDDLAGAEDYIVAPEGLSRFYWGGFSGPVVASWMTKGDRLDEIDDFCAMLSTVFRQQRALVPDNVEVILFGFSQGCATQMRWLMREKPVFHHLWLWAGTIPEDIDYSLALAYLGEKRIHAFLGDSDQLIKADYLQLYRDRIEQSGIEMQEHGYAGDHRVVRTELMRFVKTLI